MHADHLGRNPHVLDEARSVNCSEKSAVDDFNADVENTVGEFCNIISGLERQQVSEQRRL